MVSGPEFPGYEPSRGGSVFIVFLLFLGWELESRVPPRQPEEELSWVCSSHHYQRSPGIITMSIMALGQSRDVSLWLSLQSVHLYLW